MFAIQVTIRCFAHRARFNLTRIVKSFIVDIDSINKERLIVVLILDRSGLENGTPLQSTWETLDGHSFATC